MRFSHGVWGAQPCQMYEHKPRATIETPDCRGCAGDRGVAGRTRERPRHLVGGSRLSDPLPGSPARRTAKGLTRQSARRVAQIGSHGSRRQDSHSDIGCGGRIVVVETGGHCSPASACALRGGIDPPSGRVGGPRPPRGGVQTTAPVTYMVIGSRSRWRPWRRDRGRGAPLWPAPPSRPRRRRARRAVELRNSVVADLLEGVARAAPCAEARPSLTPSFSAGFSASWWTVKPRAKAWPGPLGQDRSRPRACPPGNPN
jgi:hypothetical protein